MKKAPCKKKNTGKPVGICRQAARKAGTLVEKLEICQGGNMSMESGPNRLRTEANLASLARTHRDFTEWLKMGPPYSITIMGSTTKVTGTRIREQAQAAKDAVFQATQDAILRGDAEFFERMAAVMRIEKANEAKGTLRPDRTRGDRPVDTKGSEICYYLICRSLSTPETSVSSREIIGQLEEILDEEGHGFDDGEIRRICRQLGITLPFVPGSIPIDDCGIW